jgi:hypothetical protein
MKKDGSKNSAEDRIERKENCNTKITGTNHCKKANCCNCIIRVQTGLKKAFKKCDAAANPPA